MLFLEGKPELWNCELILVACPHLFLQSLFSVAFVQYSINDTFRLHCDFSLHTKQFNSARCSLVATSSVASDNVPSSKSSSGYKHATLLVKTNLTLFSMVKASRITVQSRPQLYFLSNLQDLVGLSSSTKYCLYVSGPSGTVYFAGPSNNIENHPIAWTLCLRRDVCSNVSLRLCVTSQAEAESTLDSCQYSRYIDTHTGIDTYINSLYSSLSL